MTYRFAQPTELSEVVLTLDSALAQDPQMSHWYALHAGKLTQPPAQMPHSFRIEVEESGGWVEAARIQANHQRHVRIPLRRRTEAIRYRLESTWGPCEGSHLYGFLPVA